MALTRGVGDHVDRKWCLLEVDRDGYKALGYINTIY